MNPPTYHNPQSNYNPSSQGELRQRLKQATETGYQQTLPETSDKHRIDFDKAFQPLLEEIEECSRLTSEDLKTRLD